MNTTKIILVLLVLFLSFLIVRSIGQSVANAPKENSFKVLESSGKFEIREYESSLVASVNLGQGSYETLSRKGFNALAGYIFGGNERGQQIAMTSPVMMELGASNEMYFFMPEGEKIESLPQPKNDAVELEELPSKKVAVLQFGGWASDAKIEKYKQELQAILNDKGIEYTDTFYFMGYNAPFEVTNRKNEVAVLLK